MKTYRRKENGLKLEAVRNEKARLAKGRPSAMNFREAAKTAKNRGI